MKTLLIGTTALFAAGSLASAAQAADKIKMHAGGYLVGYLVAGSQDDGAGEPGAGRRSYKVAREGEIIFDGSTRLDNGVTFGVQVQLEAETCADQIDETYMYFQGNFGRVILGSENSAAYLMHYASPEVSPGNGLNSPTFRYVSPGTNTTWASQASYAQLTSDSEKATYFTPRIAGFQFGISFTPDNTENGNSAGTSGCPAGVISCGSYGGFGGKSDQPGVQSNAIEIGTTYAGRFSDVTVGISGSYGHGYREGGTPAGTADANEYTFGFNVGFSGLIIGAGYRLTNNGLSGNNVDSHHFNAGVRYNHEAWSFGVQYAYIQDESGIGTGGTKDEYHAVEIASSYKLGPGVLAAAGVQFHDLNDHAPGKSGDNRAVIFYLGTALSF